MEISRRAEVTPIFSAAKPRIQVSLSPFKRPQLFTLKANHSCTSKLLDGRDHRGLLQKAAAALEKHHFRFA